MQFGLGGHEFPRVLRFGDELGEDSIQLLGLLGGELEAAV